MTPEEGPNNNPTDNTPPRDATNRQEFLLRPPLPPPPEKKTPKARPPKPKGCLFFFGILLLVGAATLMGLIIVAAVFSPSGVSSLTGKPALREVFVSGSPLSQNKIAVIYVRGVIATGLSSWMKIADADAICEQLENAEKDRHVKAVVLYINSPGGGITATDKIYHYVQKVIAAHKPVVACLDEVAASGGYYIAAPANWIVAHRMTLTGSIGVIINTVNYYELLNKIGVKDEVYKSDEYKDFLNPARPRTPGEKEIVQKLVDECYNEFVRVVAEGRKDLSADQIRHTPIGDGRVYSGENALKLGVVDALGYFEDAERKAAQLALLGDDYRLIAYEKGFSLSEALSRLDSKHDAVKLSLPGAAATDGFQMEPGHLYYLYRGF